MSKLIASVMFLVLGEFLASGCIITNCPKGGKRSKTGLTDTTIKPCVSCGPGQTGQCFGPNICCGPFGCLLGTPETLRCQMEGFFNEPEPCIAGSAWCRKNTGRCAFEGICCNQDSCHSDTTCTKDKKFPETSFELYGLIN